MYLYGELDNQIQEYNYVNPQEPLTKDLIFRNYIAARKLATFCEEHDEEMADILAVIPMMMSNDPLFFYDQVVLGELLCCLCYL
jgi:hypothetical protein